VLPTLQLDLPVKGPYGRCCQNGGDRNWGASGI